MTAADDALAKAQALEADALANTDAVKALIAADDETLATAAALHTQDAATHVADEAVKAAQAAQIADLEAQLAGGGSTPPTRTVFGASIGALPGETQTQAVARVEKSWKLGMHRWWPAGIPDMSKRPPWSGGLPVMVEVDAPPAEVVAGKHDPALVAACKGAKPGDIFVYQHEADLALAKGTFTLPDFQAAWVHFGKIHRANSPKGVRTCLLLNGGAFISNAPGAEKDRRPNKKLAPLDYWPADRSGIDLLGVDVYQHGTTDPGDSAATLFQPVLDAAKTLGLKIALGEIGTRSLLSDGARAKCLSDLIAMFGDEVVAALYFESPQGKIGAWQMLGVAPEAAAVFAAACAGQVAA